MRFKAYKSRTAEAGGVLFFLYTHLQVLYLYTRLGGLLLSVSKIANLISESTLVGFRVRNVAHVVFQ